MDALPAVNSDLKHRILSGMVGGVPGATQMAGPRDNRALQAILNSPNDLRNLIRESPTAGNINMGARGGFGAGMGLGGLTGGLAGE